MVMTDVGDDTQNNQVNRNKVDSSLYFIFLIKLFSHVSQQGQASASHDNEVAYQRVRRTNKGKSAEKLLF